VADRSDPDATLVDTMDETSPADATDSKDVATGDQVDDLSSDPSWPPADAAIDAPDGLTEADAALQDADASPLPDVSAPDAPAEGGPPTGVTYRLVVKHSGKCADVYHNLTANGTALDQYTCNGTTAQTFELRWSNGSYAFAGTNSGKCMAASNGGTADGTAIVLGTCDGSGAQSFTLSAAPGGYYAIVNVASGKCIDVKSASTADGAVLQLLTCSGQDNQAWSFQ
jgi:hypothetical protein